MSIFTQLTSRIIDMFYDSISQSMRERQYEILKNRSYRLGGQQEFLKINRDGYDDNQISNYVGLIANRSVSMLFGKGIEFDFGETNDAVEGQEVQTPVKDWIDNVWKQNKKGELLQRLAKNGVDSGMAFMKIVPQQDEKMPFRLIVLDSSLMHIETNPFDVDDVEKYIYQYKTTDRNGREMSVREITSKQFTLLDNQNVFVSSWLVELYVQKQETGSKWELVQSDVWDYDFPPICHCQNDINVSDVWGQPDITSELLRLQDQYNFNTSNRNKIIRLAAHPFRWVVGMAKPAKRKVIKNGVEVDVDDESDGMTAPDKMLYISQAGPGVGVFQLEPLGDLQAILLHLENIKMTMFETTRTVDVSTIKDRMGQLTNFGLKVIYQDALQKLETKRELYGWLLVEINRRLLLLSNQADIECDLLWPDALPENEQEETVAAEADLRMGIVSKQTVSEKRGYTWEDEQERQNNERSNEDDLGGALLRAFDRNGGIREEQVR